MCRYKIKAVLELTDPFLRRQRRGKKNKKVKPRVKRFTLVSGRGCIDFTLRAPGWALHYQSNSLIWTSKTSSAIGFLPFLVRLTGIYEHQLSVWLMLG